MSWESLYTVAELQAEDKRWIQDRVPPACPIDGEPLRQGPDGVLFCISDGWQYPRDYQVPY